MQKCTFKDFWIIVAKRLYGEDKPGITQLPSDCDQYACTLTPFNMSLLPSQFITTKNQCVLAFSAHARQASAESDEVIGNVIE